MPAKTARRQAPRRLHHRHRRPGRGSPKAGAAVARVHDSAAVVAIEALPLTRTANSTLAPCRHPNTVTSTGTGLRPLPPRRSWPASTPRCSGLSASASTTPSSILVETAFCRCRSWRGRVLRACCCGHATYSSSRPWPGWPRSSRSPTAPVALSTRAPGNCPRPRSCAGCRASAAR
ncbi:linear gramicidin synthetase subunit D domain protein [Mycobacterium xenopi 4042]|uniref:Linear gramicidin synthetase subunit D domain protein n=1 Tax=Mycobacterium xenopi 4042 TaxID=1299334 RepID=X7YYL9_MYCXE|nr:linear gramicidin synthetase subunit D domain protein [Mycobacterium xenopi 4042]